MTVRRTGMRARAAAAAAVAAAAAAACRAPRPGPDELVVLIDQDPGDVDPRFAVTGYGAKIARLLCAPLVSVDSPDMSLRMELAESVDMPDDRSYLVRLRPRARFSDGRPVRAADVAFTFGSVVDPATGSPLRRGYQRIEAIEAPDDRTVRVRLREVHGTFLTDLDLGIVPQGTRPGDLSVCAGPYRLAGRDESTLRLERNPHYFGGVPATARVRIRIIRDDNARLLALVGGSADLTQNTVPPPVLDAIARRPELRVVSGPSSNFTYLGLNLEAGGLGDARVRRAIAHAIDRRRIVQAKLRGRAVLATGMLHPGHWAYSGDVPVYPHDPARARALLDEAGLADPDGPGPEPRLRLTLKTSSLPFRVSVARTIARQLAGAGIEVEVRPYEFATLIDDVRRGRFQMVTMQVTEVADPHYLHAFFHSDRIPTPGRPHAGNNRWRLRHAELDRLLDQGVAVVDRAARRALYARAQRILAEQLPVVPLFHEDNIAVLRAGVSGYDVVPNARFASLWRTRKTAAR